MNKPFENKSFGEETQVAGGPLVMSHHMPDSQSVALGLFVDTGSRDELPEQAGIAHALEHMVFKGTKKLDVHALSEALDVLGGSANAFTSRERTCFHMHVLHEDWQEALALLSDMLLTPAIPEDEWKREREVIFSEMAMVEDTPDEWAYEQHMKALFPTHSMGRPTLGSVETLKAMSHHDLRDYLESNYRPPRLLISAAGRINHQELVDVIAKQTWPVGGESVERKSTKIETGVQYISRDMEQAQLMISWAGINVTSNERPLAWLGNLVLGGSMSSFLFREVREKRGLAYHVGSHLSSYSDGGLWGVSCGADPAMLPECIDVIRSTLGSFCENIPADTLDRAKRQLEVQFRMGMDSVEGHMMYLGSRLDENSLLSRMEWIQKIQTVDADELQTWIRQHLQQDAMWSVCASDEALKTVQKVM
ncbi:MAG: pitrilysin family protein [Mariprofundaceae bacterium]